MQIVPPTPPQPVKPSVEKNQESGKLLYPSLFPLTAECGRRRGLVRAKPDASSRNSSNFVNFMFMNPTVNCLF